MARPDLRTRQAKAAQAFMRHKGQDVPPYDVIPVEGDLCWYFYYDLPDGHLELEVAFEKGEWMWAVTSFQEHADRTLALTSR